MSSTPSLPADATKGRPDSPCWRARSGPPFCGVQPAAPRSGGGAGGGGRRRAHGRGELARAGQVAGPRGQRAGLPEAALLEQEAAGQQPGLAGAGQRVAARGPVQQRRQVARAGRLGDGGALVGQHRRRPAPRGPARARGARRARGPGRARAAPAAPATPAAARAARAAARRSPSASRRSAAACSFCSKRPALPSSSSGSVLPLW
jgi:hypothetical protein